MDWTEPRLPFGGVDGIQMTAYEDPGYGWTLTVAVHRPSTRWEVLRRYTRLARPELADVMAQELEEIELGV